MNALFLPKLEDQGMKAIHGNKTTLPILKCFINVANKEIVLIRNFEDYGIDEVWMFVFFDLRLLHPIYIHLLSKKKFEKLKDKDLAQDLCYFIHMIDGLSIVYERWL